MQLLLFLLSPLSASQHIVGRKQADKCSSISWAHSSVSWGTANLIHSKAWAPSVILSLTYILNEILNAFLQHWIKQSALCNHLAAGHFCCNIMYHMSKYNDILHYIYKSCTHTAYILKLLVAAFSFLGMWGASISRETCLIWAMVLNLWSVSNWRIFKVGLQEKKAKASRLKGFYRRTLHIMDWKNIMDWKFQEVEVHWSVALFLLLDECTWTIQWGVTGATDAYI